MKALKLSILVLLMVNAAFSQTYAPLDKTPMDMAYYPDNFAHDRKFAPKKVGKEALARITYSRTAKNNREVFGNLVKFDKVWRIGANEAPEIKFYKDATINGKKVPAGTYTLFMTPGKDSWEVILNSDLDVWGAYSYDEAKNVLTFNVTPVALDTVVENLSITFDGNKKKETTFYLAWDKTSVSFPITF